MGPFLLFTLVARISSPWSSRLAEMNGKKFEILAVDAGALAPTILLDVRETGKRSERNITVSWRDIANASASDKIAVYCPWNASDPSKWMDYIEVGMKGAPYGVPYKYGAWIPYENSGAVTWAQGHGSVSFLLPNIRCAYRFAYLRLKSLAAVEEILAVTDDAVKFPKSQPLGLHLALTEKLSEIRVSWNSDTQGGTPTVHYSVASPAGKASGPALTAYAEPGSTTSYTAQDMCGSEASEEAPNHYIPAGYFHTVILKDLKLGEMYDYYVCQGDCAVQSQQFRFSAPPAQKDAQGEHTSFLMWADMGTDQYNSLGIGNVNNAAKTIALAQHHLNPSGGGLGTPGALGASEPPASPIQLITHVGDLGYACGSGLLWDLWMNLIEPVAARVPYMVAVGNHEYVHNSNTSVKDAAGIIGPSWHPAWGDYWTDSFGECGIPMARRFIMPTADNLRSQSNAPFWYAYSYGLVHFVVLSSETDFTRGSLQYAWLTDHLETVNRTDTPWLVVQMHRPMYSSENQSNADDLHLNVSAHLRLELEPLLLQAKVDLYMCGHLHSYERSCAVRDNGACVGQTNGVGRPPTDTTDWGIVHVRVGTAGGTSDDCRKFDPNCTFTPQHFMQGRQWDWREVGMYEFGLLRVDVFNSTALKMQFLMENSTTGDEAWLVR